MPIDQHIPHSIEAERSLLGAMLIDDTTVAKVSEVVLPDDFYRADHTAVYEAVLALHRQRSPIDLTTLGDQLRKDGTWDKVGGTGFAAGLMTETPTAAHAMHYADIVRTKAGLRRLITVAGKIAAAAYEEANDLPEAQSRAMSLLLEAVGKTSDGVHIYTPVEQAHAIMDMIESIEKGESRGIPTGLKNLDAITGGFNPGELIVLAARPSVGKSAMSENIAEHVARAGHTVAFFSIEMSQKMVLERWLARGGLVSSRRFIQGLTQDEWGKLYALADERSRLPIYLLDPPGASSQTIRSVMERLSLQGVTPKLAVIDYLQLIANNEPMVKGESKADRIGRITGNLKQLARQMGIPVLLLAQLNRESEHRSDDEPQLSDLRGSGDIEQDADVVLMMWREANPLGPDSPPNVRMKVAKQRNGPLGDVPIRFHGPTYKFVDA